MKITLREEIQTDYDAVFYLTEAAFKEMPYSDHSEHHLVNRLRKSDAFIPALSIVAELDGKIVGHILLTKVFIENEKEAFEILTLAPVSVLPKFHRKGIGGKLIKEAHQKAKKLGYKAVVLLGHKDYYPRFGYELCKDYGIQLPFEASEENCMIIPLYPNALKGISGVVKYPKAFFE